MSVSELQMASAILTEKERGLFAAWLLNLLPPHTGEDASAEGIQEAARRREELDSGAVQPLSSDEFWAAIEQERATWR